MVPGGVTEIIWYFAGHLQIFDDIARYRIELDEGEYRFDPQDYTTPRPQFIFTPADDELNIQPVVIHDAPTIEEPTHRFPLMHFRPMMDIDLDRFPPALAPSVLPPTPLGGDVDAGGGSVFEIKVVYQEGGEQSEIQTHQFNNMYDDDALVGTHDANLLTVLNAEADHAIAQMIAGADAAIPVDWYAPHDTNSLQIFVASHDGAWADHAGAAAPHSVTPGYYLNGVLESSAPTPPDQLPSPEPAPAPDLGHGLGQWALDGGNTAANAAYIVDLTDSARTMLVMGDYFKTNAIFQTNSYMDNDHITIGGYGSSITGGNDQANNIADFVQHPGVYASMPSYFAGPNWSVDVVHGDYFNIRALVQSNYLSDNDVTMQSSASTHYEIHAGQNELGNYVLINDGNFNYDLIVVGGSYHGMNVVFQNNILYNDDTIQMTGDGLDPNQSISSGGNQLTNTATIENYGGDNFQPWNSNLDDLIHQISGGATALDPSFGQMIAGNGGTFHILYVTGDYYDVNAVWQTNVMSDSNIALQIQGAPASATLGYYGDGIATQNVSTGGDVLSNNAAIIDVGNTDTHVNGQVYGDSILVQANLVTQESDHVVQANPQALVPEVIAFLGQDDGSDSTQPQHHPPATLAHDDPMGGILH